MLFFYEYKTGKYGIFYGTVSTIAIMNALNKFISERDAMIDRIMAEKNIRHLEEIKKNAISHEEWLKIKNKKI